MNISTPNPAHIRRRINWPHGIASLCLLLALALNCRANAIYNFSLNTTSLAGQNGNLAFDLIGGDSATSNNTVKVSGFSTDGVLADANNVILIDTDFFNEELRAITFGSFLNFTLQLTENNVPFGVDAFSFFLLDSAALYSLVTTSDPFGTDAIFAIDILAGEVIPTPVFESETPGTLVPVVAVPEGGNTTTLLLLSLGFAGLFGLFRKSSRGIQSPVG